MNPKIIKIDEEHEKNSKKIAKLQERNRELEKMRLEIENTDILGLVRSMGLTTDELAALLNGARLKQDESSHEQTDTQNEGQNCEQNNGQENYGQENFGNGEQQY